VVLSQGRVPRAHLQGEIMYFCWFWHFLQFFKHLWGGGRWVYSKKSWRGRLLLELWDLRFGIWYLGFGMIYSMFDIISDIWYLIVGIWYWYLGFGIDIDVWSDIWCDIWYFVFWYLMFDIWHLGHRKPQTRLWRGFLRLASPRELWCTIKKRMFTRLRGLVSSWWVSLSTTVYQQSYSSNSWNRWTHPQSLSSSSSLTSATTCGGFSFVSSAGSCSGVFCFSTCFWSSRDQNRKILHVVTF
jgi:hypothetical protein